MNLTFHIGLLFPLHRKHTQSSMTSLTALRSWWGRWALSARSVSHFLHSCRWSRRPIWRPEICASSPVLQEFYQSGQCIGATHPEQNHVSRFHSRRVTWRSTSAAPARERASTPQNKVRSGYYHNCPAGGVATSNPCPVILTFFVCVK